MNSSIASSTQAARSWIQPTYMAAVNPKRSSAAGSPTDQPMSRTAWCWRPKAGLPGQEPNSLGLSARHLTRALDASLSRLGWTHRSLPGACLRSAHAVGRDAAYARRLHRSGKISYYGLSNFTGWQLTKVVHLAQALGVAQPCAAAAVQPHRPRDRVGDRPGCAGRWHGNASLEPSGRRLAVRQVPARRATHRRALGSGRIRNAGWRRTSDEAPSAPGM